MSDPKISRRHWLGGIVPYAADAVSENLSLAAPEPLGPRPPGAVQEELFLARCTRCDKCVDACPESAVHLYTNEGGILAGTPVMLPDQRPCLMCDGFPCVQACPEQALVMPEVKVWTLGKVRFEESRCLAAMGPECGACADLCPQGVQALKLSRGRPVIDEVACVGCSICIEACPTSPKALLFSWTPGIEIDSSESDPTE